MKLICLGDSQTFCYGLYGADKWTSILGENLGWEVINAGINGDTTGGMLARIKRDVLDKKPDIVMIMGGGNDYIMGCDQSVVRANIMAMVQQCFIAKVKVYVASQIHIHPDLVKDEWKALANLEEVNRKTEEQSIWYPNFCNAFPELEYINLQKLYAEEVGDERKYTRDGLHPNKEGAKIIAKILTNVFNVL
ncbi:MAG: arylesterase [Lachnospiraceae bacterium]|nr:arylesterase [Candidatus Darwinimomas equi]